MVSSLTHSYFFVVVAAEVIRNFSYQCHTAEETARMWDQCKVSIGKRCQQLRKIEKQNRQD